MKASEVRGDQREVGDSQRGALKKWNRLMTLVWVGLKIFLVFKNRGALGFLEGVPVWKPQCALENPIGNGWTCDSCDL